MEKIVFFCFRFIRLELFDRLILKEVRIAKHPYRLFVIVGW